MKVTIKAGKRRPDLCTQAKFLGIGAGESLHLTQSIHFTDSCKYVLGGEDQFDINKVYGVGFGLSHHHNNSVRIGWMYEPNSDRIRIYSYAYVNGRRTANFLISLAFHNLSSAGKIASCATHIMKSGNRVEVVAVDNLGGRSNGSQASYELDERFYNSLYYYTGSYFGGTQKAPQDITYFLSREFPTERV
jgi:hypothetical protein